jgi:hypothetical protein
MTLKSIKEKAEREFNDNFIPYVPSKSDKALGRESFCNEINLPKKVKKMMFEYLDLAFKAGQEEEREEERKKRNKIIYNYRHNKHKKGICWDCSKKVVNSFYCESCAEKSRIRKLKRYHKIKNLK